jgi:hypothetical protein
MRIGIDISQIVYEGTGVGTYVRRMVEALLAIDKKNDYILFGASLRRRGVFKEFAGKCAKLVVVPIPPTILSFLWNTLHILPVETFTGPLDVFWSSDWTQPPLSHAKEITTIHDLTTLRFPKEMDSRIVRTHARRLAWVKKECMAIFCDSESTKKDVVDLLRIPEYKLHVVYPGL